MDIASNYIVSVYLLESDSYKLTTISHTSIIGKYHGPLQFNISATNKCGVKNTTFGSLAEGM